MQRRELLKLGAFLATLPAAGQTPAFFSRHQHDTITMFSDVVVPHTDTPGAKDAKVPEYLDKLLAASDRGFQEQFTGDLAALDRYARATGGTDFVALPAAQRGPLLEKMFLSDARPAFDRLKAWIARIYYATQPGFEELNKGGRVPASFGCA